MNETEEIKARLPIEQVVGSYIPLKKAGRIYKANCPFHGEKTPSFTVSPDRGIYKCFGCGEGGDIFDFVMKLEGLSFRETIELLAARAGVELKEFKPTDKEKTGPSKSRLLQVNEYAAKLWNTLLLKHPSAQPARDYLEGRGLTTESIVTFQIGYAPLGKATGTALSKAQFTGQELQTAGDPTKFQDRITFPICDIVGNTVGFTGRLLEHKEDPQNGKNRGPKYWNTPETPLFIKSRTLYALHLAKRAMQQQDLAVLAEGQMDVVMLHQAGYANTVASSGTALTLDQVKLMGRFSQNIAFAYDQDKAGIDATKRGIELVMDAGLNPFVIVVPDGKDPADSIQKDPERFKQAYEGRSSAMEWLIEQAVREHPEFNPVSKKQIVQILIPWLARITDSVEAGEWIQWLATRIQTDAANIRAALSRTGRPAPAASVQTQPSPAKPEKPQKQQLADVAAAILLTFPSLLATVKDQVSSLRRAPQTPFLEKVLPLIEQNDDLNLALHGLPEEESKDLALRMQELLHSYDETEMDEIWALQEFMVIAQRIRSDAKEEAKAKLAQDIRQAQQSGDTKRIQELFSELKNLI